LRSLSSQQNIAKWRRRRRRRRKKRTEGKETGEIEAGVEVEEKKNEEEEEGH
jgi:hypothetical protein